MGKSSLSSTAVNTGPTVRAATPAKSSAPKLGWFVFGCVVTVPGEVVDSDPGTTAPAAGGTGRDCEAAALEAATDAARALRPAESEEDLRGRDSPVAEARGPVRVAVEPLGAAASPESLDWLSEPADTDVAPESGVSAEANPTA